MSEGNLISEESEWEPILIDGFTLVSKPSGVCVCKFCRQLVRYAMLRSSRGKVFKGVFGDESRQWHFCDERSPRAIGHVNSGPTPTGIQSASPATRGKLLALAADVASMEERMSTIKSKIVRMAEEEVEL